MINLMTTWFYIDDTDYDDEKIINMAMSWECGEDVTNKVYNGCLHWVTDQDINIDD